MRVRKPKDDSSPSYQWGSGGGRTTHPVDPKGEIFGPTHWPKAAPHEKLDLTGRTAGFIIMEKPVVDKLVPTPKPATTTGLITLDDFKKEAITLEVNSPELFKKLAAIWDKQLPNEGMRRMQANNLIRNALKRRKPSTP